MALKYKLSVDTGQAQNNMGKFGKSVDDNNSKIKKLGSALKAAGAGIGAMGGVALGAGTALFALTKKVNAEKDSLLNLSNATGVSVKQLSGLQYVAQLNKTSFDSLKSGLQKMSQTMSQVNFGSKKAVQAFSDLGVSIHDNSGELRGMNEIFLDVSDALKGEENELERLTKAQGIFGRGAAEMTTLLMQGSDAIREQIGEAEKLGATYDRMDAEKAAQFNDDLLRMETALKGVSFELVNNTTPAFVSLFNNSMPLIKQLGNQLSEIMQGWSNILDDKSIEEKAERRNEILKERDAIMQGYLQVEADVYANDKKAIKWAEEYRQELQKLRQEYTMLGGAVGNFNSNSAVANDVFEHLDNSQASVNGHKLKTQSKGKSTKNGGPKEIDGFALQQRIYERKKQLILEERAIAQESAELRAESLRKQKEAEEQAHAEKMERIEAEKQARVSILDNMIALTAEGSKADRKSAIMFKTLSIGKALMNTYEGVTKALASAPPPFNIALAATTSALGMANVNKIRKQKFASGGLVRGGEQNITVNELGSEYVIKSSAVDKYGETMLNQINNRTFDRNQAYKANQKKEVNIYVQSAVTSMRGIQDYIMPSINRKSAEQGVW